MNAPFDLASPDRFAIGQPVPRKEDPLLLRGEGRYSDDVVLPGLLHAVMVRSRHAHGHLRGIDTAAARALPGVHAVLTQAELGQAGLTRMPSPMAQRNRDGSAMPAPAQTPLAGTRVRYVGDPLACVVADTQALARDAAEAVVADIDPLPAVTTAAAALAPGAPLLHDAAPGNLALDYHYGDSEAVAAAFARAAHVTRLSPRNSRIVVCAMEPRSATADYDPADGRYTLHLGCQGVFGMRAVLAEAMGVPVAHMRVLTGHVGGSFGMKSWLYPEYVCLLHAARTLGRPVKWTDARTESFLSDSHGRDHDMTVELALDADGKFLALRVEGRANFGAYPCYAIGIPATLNTVKNIVGVYATPLVEVTSRCAYSNTTPVGAYRGAGRPEGNYYMERLVDTAAAEMGIDRIELRRRNHIAPDALPYHAPSGVTYDSGAFADVLDHALALADWDGFAARRAASRARGRLRGLGLGQYLEVTAPPAREMGGIRFDADGGVTIVTGTLDYGQGHASAFAQVLRDRLGVPFERIRLLQGDSDALIAGGGTGGSKSIMASGAAIVEASAKVIEAGRRLAGHVLEAADADIEFDPREARFRIAGTDRGIGLIELARRLREGPALPAGLPTSLDVAHVHEAAPSAFPNGCHVAEVEIDPQTGVTDVVRYTMVNDFGVVINPMLVAGQAQGGVMQGIGQALLEQVAYDEDGQLLSGSYMDYALPRACHVPAFAWASHPVPARTNVLGAKGCGEAGCAGALPAVMNAVVDALRPLGITHVDMPATAERIWQAIRSRG
jgi:carbon-monoxide dehydrogenase large subunit